MVGPNTYPSSDSKGYWWYVLGTPFWRAFYLTLNYDSSTDNIGFAINDNAPTGVCIGECSSSKSSDGLGTFTIIALIIGAICLIALIYFCWHKHRQSKSFKGNQLTEKLVDSNKV